MLKGSSTFGVITYPYELAHSEMVNRKV